MFLVLIEYVDDGDRQWSVLPHGKKGLRSIFSSYKEADDIAKAAAAGQGNRFAVVEIESYYQQEPRKVKVVKTRTAS